MQPESILQEADKLVNGDRQESYGHPLDNWQHVADMASALLKRKLLEPLTAEESVMFMELVKMSRECYQPKRDNRVDMAGYAGVLDMIAEERKRRIRHTPRMESAAD